MSTIYTFNNKVLKNSANDKWLIKKEGTSFDEVTIGNQTWMSSNLAIDDGGEGITIINNNYYYTRDAAIRVAETVPGWHLPTSYNFSTLLSNVTGFNDLASTESWTYGGGTNSSGFTALALGNLTSTDTIEGVGTGARFWASNDYYLMNIYKGDRDVSCQLTNITYFRTTKLSVRLIKDS
jgi:uncharacterized protein (TIGR02145 family)